MKYQEALKEKNVKKEDLSKKVQAKIEALDKLVEKSNLAVDDDELEQYNSSISDLDNQITKDVKKFNLEVHKRRLESIASLNDKRFNKEPKEATKPIVAPVPVKTEIEKEEPEEEELPIVEKGKMKVNLGPLRQKALEAEELRLHQHRVKKWTAEQQQEQEQEPEEIQEFQKADNPKRKPKIAYGLIGLGVFFLTWGAVNLARQK
jgi:hypothetical protein